MSEELIDSLAGSVGSTIVHVDDVTTVAIELSDRLDAELVEGDAAFVDVVRERQRALAERVGAHAALELRARSDSTPVERQVVVEVRDLRSLVHRIEASDELVASARRDASDRAGAASGLAVHPTSIRDAAADVIAARSKIVECQAEVDRLDAEAEARADVAEAPGATGDAALDGPSEDAKAPRAFAGWRLTDREEIRWAAVVVAAALTIGVLVLLLTGSPLALAIPGVAVCWVVVLVVRQRDSAYDEELASRNLANVTRLTDHAYGGAGLLVDDGDTSHGELLAARRVLAEADDRLAYAEASWRSLVGPDADVDEVESVVQARDAQYGVDDAIVAELPSVRAAAAHGRRLRAQWKLAWWALDRPVPSPDDAIAGIDALEAEGITEISVPMFSVGALTDDERALLERLAGGRSDDELRSAAGAVFRAVVVADADNSISEDQFRAETAQLPDDVRFVVVASAD
ncbi:hypothetical protein [Actinospongicola halichondriae]|uniref:hypothetical protein n=1 Tax=Actinospongicola halichondriae TaxID=3236844 RepID=UPI003D4540BC